MRFEYSDAKNAWLKETRGINFDEIIDAVDNGGLLTDVENHSPKYPDQRVMIVRVNDYVYAVPYVQDPRGFGFLKTIYPSRKLVKNT